MRPRRDGVAFGDSDRTKFESLRENVMHGLAFFDVHAFSSVWVNIFVFVTEQLDYFAVLKKIEALLAMNFEEGDIRLHVVPDNLVCNPLDAAFKRVRFTSSRLAIKEECGVSTPCHGVRVQRFDGVVADFFLGGGQLEDAVERVLVVGHLQPASCAINSTVVQNDLLINVCRVQKIRPHQGPCSHDRKLIVVQFKTKKRARADHDLANGVVEARENQLMLRDKREAMELGRSSLREAQAGFDEKLSELNDTDEQQKECQARLQTLLRNAGAEEPAEVALALQAQENDRAVPAMLAETRAASCVARLEEM